MSALAAAGPRVLAAAPQVLNIAGITTLLVSIVGVVVILVAIRFLLHAHRANYSAVIGGAGILVIALIVLALKDPNHLNTMSSTLYNFLF